MNKELYVVDKNGEVIDIIDSNDSYAKLSNGDRVLRKGALEYLSGTTDIKYRFIKINHVVYGKIANKYPILNDLIEYLGYMDNQLVFRNGKPVELHNMPDICNKSLSTIKRQMKGLIKDDVIHKTKDNKNRTVFIVNPYVCLRGKRIYMSLYEEFKMSSLKSKIEECE